MSSDNDDRIRELGTVAERLRDPVADRDQLGGPLLDQLLQRRVGGRCADVDGGDGHAPGPAEGHGEIQEAVGRQNFDGPGSGPVSWGHA